MTSGLARIPLLSGGSRLGGHMREFNGQRLQLLTRVAREIDDLGRLRFPTRDVVIANSPAAIHDTLVVQARAFERLALMRTIFHPLAGRGLFTSEGELWRHQRKRMAPVFVPAGIDAHAPTLVECAARGCATWTDRSVVDVTREMRRITMAITGRTLFGIDTFDESDAIARALKVGLEWTDRAIDSLPLMIQAELLTALLRREPADPRLRRLRDQVAERLLPPIAWPTRRQREMTRAVAFLDRRVNDIIVQRRADATPGRDLLGQLLTAPEGGAAMSDRQLRDEILTLFIAGHETTANALAWSLYLLCRHPAVYAQAREVVAGLRGRTPSAGDVGRLAFLQRVFKEALRMYPPAYLLGRISVRDVTIAGHPLPAGTVVLVSPFSVHHRSDLWPEPTRFDPERFSPEREAQRARGSFIAFSDGPRVCIGAYFALLEAPLVLATLLAHSEFELASPDPIQPEHATALRPRGGIPVRVRVLARHG